MIIKQVDAFPIRMEEGSHGNVGGGVQQNVDTLGDYYISRDEWTAIYTSRHETLVIRIETTDGMVGWGESQAPVGGRAVKEIVEQLCRPVLIGRNAFDREYLWYRMYSSMRERGHITGFFVDALAGIDIALHDLIGKALGLPVYRLLGGKMRDEIELYIGISNLDSAALAEMAAEHVALGYRAFKLHLRFPSNRQLIEYVSAVRDEVGPDIGLMLDIHTTRDVSGAIGLGRGLEALDVMWLEAPIAPEDVRWHAEVAAALDLRIATGEWLRTSWEWRQWIDLQGFDVAMPDIARTGLSEGKRIAALCDAYNKPISPHISGGGILSVAASIHYSAIPNFQTLEHAHRPLPIKARIASKYPEPKNGAFHLDETPGLGVEIDEKELERFTYGR